MVENMTKSVHGKDTLRKVAEVSERMIKTGGFVNFLKKLLKYKPKLKMQDLLNSPEYVAFAAKTYKNPKERLKALKSMQDILGKKYNLKSPKSLDATLFLDEQKRFMDDVIASPDERMKLAGEKVLNFILENPLKSTAMGVGGMYGAKQLKNILGDKDRSSSEKVIVM